MSASNEYEGASRNRRNGIKVPRLKFAKVNLGLREGKSKITRVGVDLAKRQIQVYSVDAGERVVLAKAMSREKFAAWCAELPPGCIVATEAASSAHHWARKLAALGFQPRLIAPHFVTPYRMEGKGGENDAADAAAICEAATRPSMRFVPVKSLQQQSQLMVHRARQGFVSQRTATINRIRGLLSELGIVLPLKASTVRREAMHQLEDLPGWANTVIGDLLSDCTT